MKPIRIENWQLCGNDDGYKAPEQRVCWLQGEVYDHPKYPGVTKTIRTNFIRSSEGRLVTTNSGTVYDLGIPSIEYQQWLKENNLVLDERQPIKIIQVKSSKELLN